MPCPRPHELGFGTKRPLGLPNLAGFGQGAALRAPRAAQVPASGLGEAPADARRPNRSGTN